MGRPAERNHAIEKAERVVHLVLGALILAGSALIVGTALFGNGAPFGGTSENRAEVAAAPAEQAAPKPLAKAEMNGSADKKAAAVDEMLLNAKPIMEAANMAAMPENAPEPLAPPTAEMREKLAAAYAPSMAGAPAASDALAYAPATAEPAKIPGISTDAMKPAEQAKAEDDGRMTKCYVRLGGRVQANGACRVRHGDDAVTFDLPGRNLSLTHARGKAWTAALGDRELGRVYKRGSCWGGRRLYVCDNG